MRKHGLNLWLGCVTLGLALLSSTSCGDVNVRDGMTAGYRYCQSYDDRFHFKVLIPPWKYSKEYRCSQCNAGTCVGVWNPTGRHVWVVSDVPFVNYDSEIIASMDVEYESGSTANLVSSLVLSEGVGNPGSNASYVGDSAQYPKEIVADPEGGLGGHELLWRQDRTFEGNNFNWYRRDVFLRSNITSAVYHLKFFSIETLNKPEFDKIISTFREGSAVDGGESCPIEDGHNPADPNQDC